MEATQKNYHIAEQIITLLANEKGGDVMTPEIDLLTSVGQKCLQKVSDLLDDKTAPAAATAETVKIYADIALAIEAVNLRKAEQSRFAARVFRARPSSLQAEEN